MTGALVVPESLAPDFASLTALLDTYGHAAIPCRTSNHPERWTGDDREQAKAATECRACPARDQCLAYGLRNPRELGTYGGLTERERIKRARGSRTKEMKQ